MRPPGRCSTAVVAFLLIGALAGCQDAAPPGPPAAASTAEAAAAGPALDVAAPDFSLITLDGQSFRLEDARGRLVVLNFWASWCGPCRDEMPLFETTSRALRDEVLFVGVNATASDIRGDAEDFAHELEISFPIVFDESGDVATSYGVRALPATFFIDRDGVLRARALGPVLADRLREHLDLVRHR